MVTELLTEGETIVDDKQRNYVANIFVNHSSGKYDNIMILG